MVIGMLGCVVFEGFNFPYFTMELIKAGPLTLKTSKNIDTDLELQRNVT